MTIHDLWNECVDKTNDVPSCLELYTEQIKKTLFEDIDKLMPNADNTNPCMKCGAVQCARCGFDLLNEYHKIKKRHLSTFAKGKRNIIADKREQSSPNKS